jgi:hypothetical protein
VLGTSAPAYPRRALAALTRWLSSWARPPVHYPSLHYRYSHDIANVLELQASGVYARSGVVKWKPSRAMLLTIINLSPIAVATVLAIDHVSSPPRRLALAYFGWLSYFLFLTIFEFAIALVGVSIFHNLTDYLEKLLTPRGRDTYDKWANYATARTPQITFAIVFSTGACLALWIAASVHGMSTRLYIALPSYMAVGACSFFISQAAYWVITGTVLAVLLTRAGHMEPSWHSPAYTPGIELLARLYRLAFYGASIGVALCLFPLLTWVYKGPDSGPLLVVKVSLFVGSVTSALLIAVIPQWRLSTVVAQRRRLTIDQLEALLPSDVSSITHGGQSEPTLLAWLQIASTSPSTTVQSSTIAGILLGLTTAMLPYILRLVA